MIKNNSSEKLAFDDKFYRPLEQAFQQVKKRKCNAVSDWQHLKSGIERCIHFNSSGREWVQKLRDFIINPSLRVSTFFATLKSARRLKLVKQVNRALIKDCKSPLENDPFAEIKELDKYEIYAGDGHFHKHAVHDTRKDRKHYPVGHIFMLNLRTNLMAHLDVTRPKNKKEHEITALKRIGADALRLGAAKGRRVINVYDPAVVDFQAWYKWKKSKGVYIITKEKENMRPLRCGYREFDKKDPRNAGVISDESIGPGNGVLIRRIKYQDSISGEVYSFITNVMDVPPGIIAFIYKLRWDIEKIFDSFKNWFNEYKAWAANNNAKSQNAVFLCLAHNLLLLLEREIEEKEGIKDEKIIARREKYLKNKTEKIKSENKPLNSLALKLRSSAQMSCQFVRLVRAALIQSSSWLLFIEQLRPYMKGYLT